MYFAVNSGTDGLDIDCANANSGIIKLETAKITMRRNALFIVAMFNF